MTAAEPAQSPPQRGPFHYLINVLWTWMAVAVTILAGIFVSPYIIRKIGKANFGIYTLALSLIEYFWLIDLGLRSATVKLTAEYHTLGEREKMNAMISTAVVYSALAGVIMAIVTLLLAPRAPGFFHVTEPEFPMLIIIAGLSWSFGLVFNIMSACLDGIQRFDIFGRILSTVTLLRSLAVVMVLHMGYGLFEMGIILLVTQTSIYAANFIAFRKVMPEVRISWNLASFSMLREMMRYGVHSLTSNAAERIRDRSVPILIAKFLPLDAVTYFSVPSRIMQYAIDGIGRVGTVVTPSATEMAARKEYSELAELGIYANRYCLALFLPITAFLLVYGFQVYALYINLDFAKESAFLLPILLIGNAATAGQFNSVSILFGIGRHQRYAQFILVEAIVTVMGMIYVLPHYGLWGGAMLVSGLMILIRTLVVCVITARELKINPFSYAARIYVTPTLIALVCMAFVYWLKRAWLPGSSWIQLGIAGILMMIPYTIASYLFTIDAPHRALLRSKLGAKLGFSEGIDDPTSPPN